jgi:hypothetical protein
LCWPRDWDGIGEADGQLQIHGFGASSSRGSSAFQGEQVVRMHGTPSPFGPSSIAVELPRVPLALQAIGSMTGVTGLGLDVRVRGTIRIRR